MERYLCIHGHFYQPPRENPWLEVIENQDSARPYKNWNERITAECYYPNANARILNAARQVRKIVNNYENISFNFGPTLLSWLQRNGEETYQAILDADKKSLLKQNGHGNALAQIYNHIIMPLADEHDKETQIIWGIKDFERRFNRAPEGLWLAETACDTQTLMLLAANGIKFTILAPGQCKKTRKIGAQNWRSEDGAKVDPKRPYLCRLPNGKTINLFFYDGPISQGIAFGNTLTSGDNFAKRLTDTFDDRPEPQLVHIATDGETYGHHQRFAEMALAYCIDHIQKNKSAEIINYGHYLEKFPPQHEAVINENTSWSCAHGIERWRGDCGCNCSGKPHWNQKWRAPLRIALNSVHAKMRHTFETLGKEYFYDIWAARNAYINVILDRSAAARFITQYGTQAARADMPTAFKLMQMQLNAMLMYTSCGWFFDELSGIETVQIMAYAKRAIGYNKALTDENLEPDFIKLLAAAPSNMPAYRDGAQIYNELVKPLSIGLRKVAINYGVSYLLDEILFGDRIYSYHISDQRVDVLNSAHAKLVAGYGAFVSDVTTEQRKLSFALLHNGGADITAGAAYGCTAAELKRLKEVFSAGDIEKTREFIKNNFPEVLTMGQLLKEKQKQILAKSVATAQARVEGSFKNIFNRERHFFNYFKEASFSMPPIVLDLAEFVLNNELKHEILKDIMDEDKISKITADIKSIGAKINEEMLKQIMTKRLEGMADTCCQPPAYTEGAAEITTLLAGAQKLALPVNTYKAGNIIFRKAEAMPEEIKNGGLIKNLCAKLNLTITESD